MLCLLMMPFVGIFLLPFLLLKLMFRAIFGLLMLPIVLLVMFAVFAALALGFAMAVLVPLSPLLLIAFIVWAVTRNSRAATVVRG